MNIESKRLNKKLKINKAQENEWVFHNVDLGQGKQKRPVRKIKEKFRAVCGVIYDAALRA